MLKRLTIKPKLGPSAKKAGSILGNGMSGKSTTVIVEKENISIGSERKVLEKRDVALPTDFTALENEAINREPKPQEGNLNVNVNPKLKQEYDKCSETVQLNLSETSESIENITGNKNTDELTIEAVNDIKKIDTSSILSKAKPISNKATQVEESSKTVLKSLEVKSKIISQSNNKNVCKSSLVKYGSKKMLKQLSLKPKYAKPACEKLREIRKKENKHETAETKQNINEALAELASQIRSEAKILPETGVEPSFRKVTEEKINSDLHPVTSAKALQTVRKDGFQFNKIKQSRRVNGGIDSNSIHSDSINGFDTDSGSVTEMQKTAQKKMIKLKRSKDAEFEHFYNIRDRFIEKLAKEGEEQIDPSELSISELCFYSKEFFSKLKPKIEKRNEKKMKAKELETNQTLKETTKTVTVESEKYGRSEDPQSMNAPPVEKGPVVTFDEEGNFQIDMQSLEIETEEAAAERRALESQTAVDSRNASFTRFGKPKARKRRTVFSQKETAKFYTALGLIGTNFDKMTQFLPHYTRNELLNKFKSEDKKNPELITNLLKKVKFDIDVYSQLLDSSEEENEDEDESKERRKKGTGPKMKDESNKEKMPKKRKATEGAKKSRKKSRVRHTSVNTIASSSTLFDCSVDVDMGLDETVKNDGTGRNIIDFSDFNEATLDLQSDGDENTESFSETAINLSRSLSVNSVCDFDSTKDYNISSGQNSIAIADTESNDAVPSALPETCLSKHTLMKHSNYDENTEKTINLSGRCSVELLGGFDVLKDSSISQTELPSPNTNSSSQLNNVLTSTQPEKYLSAKIPSLLKPLVSNDHAVTEKKRGFLGNVCEDSDTKFTTSKIREIPEIDVCIDNSKLFGSYDVKRNGVEVPFSLKNVETLAKLVENSSCQESVLENTCSESSKKSHYYVSSNEIMNRDLSPENNFIDTLNKSSGSKQVSPSTDKAPKPTKKTTGHSLLRSLSMKPTIKKKFISNSKTSSSSAKSGVESSLQASEIDNKGVPLSSFNSKSEKTDEDSQRCSFSEKQMLMCPSVAHKLSSNDSSLTNGKENPSRLPDSVNAVASSCASSSVVQLNQVVPNTQPYHRVSVIQPLLSDSCQKPSQFTRSTTKPKKLASFRNLIVSETPNSVYNWQQCDSLSLSEHVPGLLKIGSFDTVSNGGSVKSECPVESPLNSTKVETENCISKSTGDTFDRWGIDSNAFNELSRQIEATQVDQSTFLGSGDESGTGDESAFQGEKILQNIPSGSLIIVPFKLGSDLGSVKVFRKC